MPKNGLPNVVMVKDRRTKQLVPYNLVVMRVQEYAPNGMPRTVVLYYLEDKITLDKDPNKNHILTAYMSAKAERPAPEGE